MSVDCYYGFGFATNSIDERKVIEFCKNHKDTLNNLDEELVEEIEDNDDFSFSDYEVDADNGYSDNSAANIIANIMSNETGIDFSVEEDTDCLAYILFEAKEPWAYNEKEKALTSQKLLEIYQRYAEELGFDYSLEYICVEKISS
jgi:hypothetical protein